QPDREAVPGEVPDPELARMPRHGEDADPGEFERGDPLRVDVLDAERLARDRAGVLQAGEPDVPGVHAEGAGDVGHGLVRGEPGLLDDEVDVIASPLGGVEGDLFDDEVL